MIHVSLFVVLLLCSTLCSNAQIRFRIAAGLSTDWIVSDNPAVYRLIATEEGDSLGGAFDGAQVGFGIKGYVDLDKQKYFRIPIGVDYFAYNGAQSLLARAYQITIRHSTTIITPHIGFEWAFVEFPYAFARAYVGVEARAAHIGANSIEIATRTLNENGDWVANSREVSGKDAVWRLGGMARLGVEGELYYPVFINTSVGYGVMNALLRDTKPTAEGGRGELLTPESTNERGEGYLNHLNFTFMVQVRL
jgi:hypothetical protein